MIISKCVSDTGVIIDLVSCGYSDLCLKLSNGDEIDVIKSMLCYSNATFKKLICDNQCENPLKLADGISKESMMLLIRYYGCGKIDINEDNVGDLVVLCLSYNEKDLLINLTKYCLNHLSIKIVKCILNNIELFQSEIMCELYIESENFIKSNCIYLFEREELLEINISGIKHILSINNLKLNNENQILTGLLEYYKEKKEEIENDKENKSQFEELFKYVNWDEFTIKSIPLKDLKQFNGIYEIILNPSENEINHEYYPIPEISNPKLLKYLNKYCFNPTLLLDDDYRHNEIENGDLNFEDIIKILNYPNLRLIKILIIIVKEYEKKKLIEDTLTHRFLYDILNEYKNNEISEIEKQLTLKSLPFIINDKRISKIYDIYGYKILFELLNICQLSSDIISLISSFIRDIKILEEENITNEMKEVIKDEKMQKIVLNPLTYFKYPLNHILVDLKEDQSIKCEHDGDDCIFSISPDLPDGIKFNKESGEIIIESSYRLSQFECEVKCKQYYIEKSFQLSIEINYMFIENYKSNRVFISENGKKITCNNGSYNQCYLNVKMENGIYHIKYKTTFTGNNRPGFGVSTINNYNGNNIDEDQNSLSIWMNEERRNGLFGSSKLYCSNTLYGSNQVTNPNFTYQSGDIYEMIYDMDKRIISIKQNDGEEIIIFENIPSPLYPFVFAESCIRNKSNFLNIIEICN